MISGPFEDALAAYETPRIVRLLPNLHAACFPLMKLLPARFMLDRAAGDRMLAPGGRIAETTSGSFGLALAMLAAVRGYQLTLVSASSLLDARFRHRIEQLGAEVVVTRDRNRTGDQVGRLQRLEAIRAKRPDTFWPRQYDNPNNPLAYARLAELVARALGQVDCLVGCVGSGGSLCGTGSFLREPFPELRMIAVDTHSSVLFEHTAGPRMLRGLGNSIMPANLNHALIDEVHWVGALPAFAAARALYREHALYMGPTSGAAALVARWYALENPGAATLVILPDEGHRYQDTVFSETWLAGLAGWPPDVKDRPIELDHIAAGGEADWTCYAWGRQRLSSVLTDNPDW